MLKVNLPGEKYKLAVETTERDGRIYLKFPYNKKMLEEVKAMQNPKWHGYDTPPLKLWSVPKTQRNVFTLRFLAGENVYARYEELIVPNLKLKGQEYPHQVDMAAFMLARRRSIIAGEMGTGKTLAAILAMENSGFTSWWWIGTKSALRAVDLEFSKWKATVRPRFLSYDSLKKVVENWTPGDKAPQGIVFDECQKIKTPTAQRSIAAKWIVDSMAQDWCDKELVILMSGSPAPKDPCDWFWPAEVACPGFVREGDVFKFKRRLCIMKDAEGANGVYKEIVAWLDDERKCAVCGQLKTEHDMLGDHVFQKSINEVAKLYKRLQGLVLIKFKKDVLSFLPEKRYEIITVKPTNSTIRTAATIVKTAKSTISGLIKLRELSDGFQYTEKVIGEEVCPNCHGTKEAIEYYLLDDPERKLFDVQITPKDKIGERKTQCELCSGKGTVKQTEIQTVQVSCPKEDALVDLMELHEDVGRLVVYAGFTGSVDRCVGIAQREGWAVIRVDGRGWLSMDWEGNELVGEPLNIFQNEKELYPKVCFIGHPGSAGTGLTLTASPSIIYYSNDYNADSRIQSEDRIHRPGMDLNKGATIYDIVHLPTDKLVLDNLKKKRDLQAMTLGDIKEVFDAQSNEHGGTSELSLHKSSDEHPNGGD